MPKSNYEIAKQIISESQKSVFIFKSQFEKLNSIFSLSSVPDSDFWENIFKKNNSIICCAVLESPFATPFYKKKALFDIKKSLIDSSKSFFVPFVFHSDNKILSGLNRSLSKEIVEGISWNDLTCQMKDYIIDHPDITTLPFSQTTIEELLIYKLLFDKKALSTQEIEDYNSYKILEYCNGKILNNMIGDISLFHENVATAVFNNKNTPTKLKKETFMCGINLSEMKNSLDSSVMKEIYESVICTTTASEKDDEIAELGRSSINKLIEYNLLPESCEIDLIDRITSNDVFLSLNTIDSFVKNTNSNIVIEKSINCNDINIIISALQNPLSTYSQVISAFQKYIDEEFPFTAICSSESKLIFFKSCLKFSLPLQFYDKMLEAFSHPSQHALKNTLMSEMAKSHATPISVLDKLIEKRTPHSITVLSPLVYFNKNTKHLCSDIANKFLDTINAILYKVVTIDNSETFYFPNLYSPIGEELEELLHETIKTNSSSFIKECSQKCLNILYEQNRICEAKKYLDTFEFENAPIDVLRTIKKVIQNEIINSYPHNSNADIYSKYLLYKKFFQYTDIYRTVDEILQKKITQEKSLSSKLEKEKFNECR